MLSAYLDGRVFGEESGLAPRWLLCLHGWRRTHADFAGLLASTGEEAPGAVALDLPGFGASPPPPVAWGSRQYAEAIAPLLDGLAERVVVLGHSFGGCVALELALCRPDRVGALVLAGVPLVRREGRKRPALHYRALRTLARAHLVGSARLEAARARYGSADYRAAQGVMREVLVRVLAEDYSTELGLLSCPVELVWGGRDEIVPLAVAKAAQASLRAARLTVVEGVDHFVPTAAPQALRAAALAVR